MGTDSEILKTRILFLPANFHFYIVALLYFFLIIGIIGACTYNYMYMPTEFMGMPVPEQVIEQAKEMVWRHIGASTCTQFFFEAVFTVLMTLYKNKYWLCFCTALTGFTLLGSININGIALIYFELKYTWPVYVLLDLATPPAPGVPFTVEQAMENFVKVSVTALTVAMFAVVAIQAYCLVILVKVSFFSKPKQPEKRIGGRMMTRERIEEPVVEEEAPTGTGTDADDGDVAKKS